jgi:hypothetical protein
MSRRAQPDGAFASESFWNWACVPHRVRVRRAPKFQGASYCTAWCSHCDAQLRRRASRVEDEETREDHVPYGEVAMSHDGGDGFLFFVLLIGAGKGRCDIQRLPARLIRRDGCHRVPSTVRVCSTQTRVRQFSSSPEAVCPIRESLGLRLKILKSFIRIKRRLGQGKLGIEGSTTSELCEERTYASAHVAAGTTSRHVRDILMAKLAVGTAPTLTYVNHDPA